MQPLSVSALNAQIKGLLEATFLQVCVSGEVSNFTHHTSGHLYFTLKDENAALKCVMFRGNALHLKFKITEGMELTLNGAISVYAPRGEYQLNCLTAIPKGMGALTLAFEQLKQEYQAKGYFANKKPLPKFPKRVALITSKTGAVLHDMLSIAKKRWGLAEFVLLDTLVQGDGAKEAIAKQIQQADSLHFDCIVLARGGGSLEDLWAFNEPLVVEAIFKANTPIISAIGHEPDVVLSDFVADVRAPTPTAAMEILLPDKNEWLMLLDSMQNMLNLRMQRLIDGKKEKCDTIKSALDKNPFFKHLEFMQIKIKQHKIQFIQKMEHRILESKMFLNTPKQGLDLKIKQKIMDFTMRLNTIKTQAESKNPSNYQKSGYACVLREGKKIEKLATLEQDSIIELQDKSAIITAQIQAIQYLNKI